MKLTTFLVLIKFHRILFIIIWNITRELVSLKNITISSNNSSKAVNTIFYSFFFFIHILLYLHYKSNLVITQIILIVSIFKFPSSFYNFPISTISYQMFKTSTVIIVFLLIYIHSIPRYKFCLLLQVYHNCIPSE